MSQSMISLLYKLIMILRSYKYNWDLISSSFRIISSLLEFMFVAISFYVIYFQVKQCAYILGIYLT